MTQTGKTVVKWILLTFLMAYTIGMCFWSARQAQARRCEGLDIRILSESRSVSPKTVENQILGFSQIKGKPISSISVREIERMLSKCNNYEEVECGFTSGGKLCVEVVPLVPELRVFIPRSSYYINRKGKRVEADAEFYTDVPLAMGRFSSKFRPTDLFPLVDFINKDSLMKNLVTMIEVRSPDDIILIPRIKGHVINFGNTKRLNEKLTSLKLFYHKVMPYKGWNNYDTISVKFNGMIVCTRKDKSIRLHGTEDTDGELIEEENLSTLNTSSTADTPSTSDKDKRHE